MVKTKITILKFLVHFTHANGDLAGSQEIHAVSLDAAWEHAIRLAKSRGRVASDVTDDN